MNLLIFGLKIIKGCPVMKIYQPSGHDISSVKLNKTVDCEAYFLRFRVKPSSTQEIQTQAMLKPA